MKKIIALFVFVLCFLCGAVFAEGDSTDDFPELNEQGFLDGDEFVYENADEGIWRFCNDHLKVEIIRRTEDSPKKIWYECEIWSDGENFDILAADPNNRMRYIAYPFKTARENKSVFAITADFAHLRIQKKSKSGVIIRDGEVLGTRTYPQNKKNVFPNLDSMAILPDGSMPVFFSDEHTAEEYLEMGATDVLSFGPIMVRDGELNTKGLKRYGTTKQPRASIGMVSPGHYFVMLVEGRHPGSRGASIEWVAEQMLQLGCTTALNLDGGQSAGIVFMGKQLNLILNSYKRPVSCRKSAEIIAIGTSDQVLSPDEPF